MAMPYPARRQYSIMLRTLWRRQWHPTPVLLPGKSHGQRSLVGCSPWGHEESDKTERLHFHFSLSCIGEGNGNPLHCSWLENPRDGEAWWAAVHGVAQSWTRLKWLSSKDSIQTNRFCFILLIVLFYLPHLKFQMNLPHDFSLCRMHLMPSQVHKPCSPSHMEQEQSLTAKNKPKTRIFTLEPPRYPPSPRKRVEILALERGRHRIPNNFSLRHSTI